MEFMTKEYVEQEAAKGDLEALRCSLLHHEQGRDATRGELIDAFTNGKFNTGHELCACCIAFQPNDFKTKSTCPLADNGCHEKCCNSLWLPASSRRSIFAACPTNDNHQAFKDAESKVCDYIQGVIDGLEKKKKPEVTYSIGDRFKSYCSKYILVSADGKVGLTGLESGETPYPTIKVVASFRITPKEFDRIHKGVIIRYWDARKRCKC